MKDDTKRQKKYSRFSDQKYQYDENEYITQKNKFKTYFQCYFSEN